jgi:peptidyl-prolyl cis-trans isomerase A (cyclophilin A)
LAPLGADRFYNLVKNGFYDDCRFFRIIDGFMAQIGMHGDPSVMKAWTSARLQDDPVKESNKRGYVTFAHAGPQQPHDAVLHQLQATTAPSLDKQGFPPIGQVTTGMDVVDKLYSGYGEGAPRGQGPSQGNISAQGNAYLAKDFPKLDYVKKATIEP